MGKISSRSRRWRRSSRFIPAGGSGARSKATAPSWASRADEAATALELKLEVARAYVDVLRTRRAVAVARSNVESLSAQARDVKNLVAQGRGIRNDLLAAQVARANAQQREIQTRNRLSIAWATYNRYLCRPMDTVVPLEELAHVPPPPRNGGGADTAVLIDVEPIVVDEAQIQALFEHALRNRSELASLYEQSRSTHAQAAAERATTRPQVSFLVANLYQNVRFLPTQADSGAAAFVLNWTLFDGGKSRRHAMALEQCAAADISRRDDLAAGIKLQIRSSWLTCQENQRRIPLTRAAIAQAEENLRVARRVTSSSAAPTPRSSTPNPPAFRATTITIAPSMTPSSPSSSFAAPSVRFERTAEPPPVRRPSAPAREFAPLGLAQSPPWPRNITL